MNQKVLHPDFPVIEGEYFLSKFWTITLPAPFNRRVDNDSLVLWRPNLTFWMTQYENKEKRLPREMVLSLIVNRSNKTYDYKEFEIGDLFVTQYFEEEIQKEPIYKFHYVIASEDSMISVQVHTKNKEYCNASKQICQTIKQSI